MTQQKKEIELLYEKYQEMKAYRQHFMVLEGGLGVGKTFLAQQVANKIVEPGNETQISIYQFHEGYSYENFVYGLQATTINNSLGFAKGGQPLLKAIDACAQDEKMHVLILDDINRTDIMATFGDLFSALEPETGNAIKTDVGDITIPDNLFILATLNPLVGKHSIDYAWFRRFTLIELRAQCNYFETDANSICEYQLYLNYAKEIFEHVQMLFDLYFADPDNRREKEKYRLGHGLFLQYDCELSLKENLVNLHHRLKYIVAPLLEEYIRQGVLEDYAQADVCALADLWGKTISIEPVGRLKGEQFPTLYNKVNGALVNPPRLPSNAFFFFVLHSADRLMKVWNKSTKASGCLVECEGKNIADMDENVNAKKQGHRGAYGSTRQSINGTDYHWVSGTAHGSFQVYDYKAPDVAVDGAKDVGPIVTALRGNMEYVINEKLKIYRIIKGD